MSDDSLATVFESSNPALLALAKSVLEGAGIEFSTVGESTGAVFAGNPLFGRVRIVVGEEDVARATALLEELRESDEA